MDQFDCKQYAKVYRLLAEILERERPAEEQHASFILGDLARRVFVETPHLPPDEILEEISHVIRSGETNTRGDAARRLRDHANHLDQLETNG